MHFFFFITGYWVVNIWDRSLTSVKIYGSEGPAQTIHMGPDLIPK